MHPFVTRIRNAGMMEAMDVDQEEMRAQLAQIAGAMGGDARECSGE